MCLNFFIKHKITNLLELLFYCRKSLNSFKEKKLTSEFKHYLRK